MSHTTSNYSRPLRQQSLLSFLKLLTLTTTMSKFAESFCYAGGIRSSLRSCLQTATELLKSDSLDNPFPLYRLKLIIVDEAQDLNPVQCSFVDTLSNL
ncbi:hypothetical protein GEMRC1_006865 [Eukaryota sp. GEM-RC1]